MQTGKLLEMAMNAFIRGFKRGVQETLQGFWAPAVALWDLLSTTTDKLTGDVTKQDR
ncbi:hypothetical protein D3C86_2205820 [compost metagenome]|jgi:hypothetical protein